MRRKFYRFGLAIATIAAFGPMQVWGGDREIAEQIISRLKTNRDSGALKDFTLDMKVDKGVVLFRGNVSQSVQKELVLKTAEGIDGISRIVDEVSVTAASDEAKLVKPVKNAATVDAETAQTASPQPAAGFSFSQALAAQAAAIRQETDGELVTAEPEQAAEAPAVVQAEAPRFAAQPVVPGSIMPTAAVELNASPMASSDEQVVASVIGALGAAQRSGQLRGFGVDVTSSGGIVNLNGRAASEAQRQAILDIVQSTAGVAGVEDSIQVAAAPKARVPEAPVLADAPTQTVSTRQNVAQQPMVHPVSQPMPTQPTQQMRPRGYPAQMASGQQMAPQAMAAPYRMNTQQVQANPASYGQMGAPVMGQPVPMAPYGGGAAAPRYDSPNLPPYAWPGYSSHPNYAALSYPQQYSPSAWPYIGPFYPYPQVPLGWRKVSLEWDDGWWFLDFTDR